MQIVPIGTRVRLEADPRLDNVDRYGRLLRYVHRGPLNANVLLVACGAASPYFYGATRQVRPRMLADAQRAKAAKRGLWGACPGTVLDPYQAVDTGTSGPPTKDPPPNGKCDPNYSAGAFRLIRLTLTAPTSGRSASRRSGAPAATRTASTVTTTGSAASDPLPWSPGAMNWWMVGLAVVIAGPFVIGGILHMRDKLRSRRPAPPRLPRLTVRLEHGPLEGDGGSRTSHRRHQRG